MDPNQQPGAPMPPQGAPMAQPSARGSFTPPQPQRPPQVAQPQQVPGAPYMPPQGAPRPQGAANGGDFMKTLATRIQLGKLHIIYADFITFFGALLGVIAVFVPFFSYSGETVALIASDSGGVFFGWQFLVLTVAIAGLAFINNKAVPLTLAIVYVLLFIDNLAWGGLKTYGGLHYHIGFYLMLFAAIFMLAGAIIAMWLESQQTKLLNGTARPAQPAPTAYPAPTNAYVNNGWQSGVPPQQSVGTTDTSNWQFGVPNQPLQATPAPAQPAPNGQFPVAPSAAPSAAPAAPAAPNAAESPLPPYAAPRGQHAAPNEPPTPGNPLI